MFIYEKGSRDTRVLVESASVREGSPTPRPRKPDMLPAVAPWDAQTGTFPPWEEAGAPSPGVRWLLDEVEHLMNYG